MNCFLSSRCRARRRACRRARPSLRRSRVLRRRRGPSLRDRVLSHRMFGWRLPSPMWPKSGISSRYSAAIARTRADQRHDRAGRHADVLAEFVRSPARQRGRDRAPGRPQPLGLGVAARDVHLARTVRARDPFDRGEIFGHDALSWLPSTPKIRIASASSGRPIGSLASTQRIVSGRAARSPTATHRRPSRPSWPRRRRRCGRTPPARRARTSVSTTAAA
jgi:hypothetical protein